MALSFNNKLRTKPVVRARFRASANQALPGLRLFLVALLYYWTLSVPTNVRAADANSQNPAAKSTATVAPGSAPHFNVQTYVVEDKSVLPTNTPALIDTN